MNNNNIRKKYYPIDRKNMGKCLIINNIKFEGKPKKKRKGAADDCERLKTVFGKLGFKVLKPLTNLDSEEMLKKIRVHARMKDNKESSAFVLVIMSHGGEGYLRGTEPKGKLYVKDIVEALNNENCSVLRGKPKLCFFQACNGKERAKALEDEDDDMEEEEDIEEEEETEEEDASSNIYPIVSEILLSFAAPQGFKTCRCPIDGGRYINCLAEALEDYAKVYEIRDILEIVEEKIRKIRTEVKGDKICMSTEVKLLGWDRKFYFYPQQQADGSESTSRDFEELKEIETPNQPRQALNVISGLCVIGGSKPPECLSAEGDSWRTLDGTGLEGFDYCQAIAYHNNSVYIASDRGLLAWMPKCNANITCQKFENPRQWYAHAFLNGKIYVLGGQVDGGPNKKFWVYDTQNTIWEEEKDLSSFCSGRSAVLLRDKFYITPGEQNELTNKLYTFDPEKHNWSRVPSSMMMKRCWHATATCGTYIWVFGGQKEKKLNVCKDVERYNFKTQSWERMAPMPTARSHLSVTYFKGKFYATGGIGEKGTDLDVVEIYNLQKDKWTKGPSLDNARSVHNAIVIPE